MLSVAADSAVGAGLDPVAQGPRCPRCEGPVIRVRRRFVDRLLSRFVPLRRYRCPRFGCSWEGNLRDERDGPAAAPPT